MRLFLIVVDLSAEILKRVNWLSKILQVRNLLLSTSCKSRLDFCLWGISLGLIVYDIKVWSRLLIDRGHHECSNAAALECLGNADHDGRRHVRLRFVEKRGRRKLLMATSAGIVNMRRHNHGMHCESGGESRPLVDGSNISTSS